MVCAAGYCVFEVGVEGSGLVKGGSRKARKDTKRREALPLHHQARGAHDAGIVAQGRKDDAGGFEHAFQGVLAGGFDDGFEQKVSGCGDAAANGNDNLDIFFSIYLYHFVNLVG